LLGREATPRRPFGDIAIITADEPLPLAADKANPKLAPADFGKLDRKAEQIKLGKPIRQRHCAIGLAQSPASAQTHPYCSGRKVADRE